MLPLDEQTLRDALRRVKYPGFSRDIVSFGLVKEIRIEGEGVAVQLVLTTAEQAVARQIRAEAPRLLEFPVRRSWKVSSMSSQWRVERGALASPRSPRILLSRWRRQAPGWVFVIAISMARASL